MQPLLRTLATLLLGGMGAFAASRLGLPAPLIIGPAILVTIAGLFALPAQIPSLLRDCVFVILGCVMGAGVTPQVLQAAHAWPLSLVLLIICVAAIMAVTASLLQALFRQDRLTAVLSSAPGHLSFVMGLGADSGGNMAAISIVQSIRLLSLTLIVPIFVTAFGHALPQAATQTSTDLAPAALPMLLAIAAAAGIGLRRVGMPAAYLMGGLFISSAAHISGMVEGAIPAWLSVPAYVAMGSLIGSRFAGVSLHDLGQYALAGLVSTFATVAIAALGAWVASGITGLPLGQVLIAFAPGGVETMSAMAVLMHADPAYVAAHHVLRLFALTALIPLFLGRRTRRG